MQTICFQPSREGLSLKSKGLGGRVRDTLFICQVKSTGGGRGSSWAQCPAFPNSTTFHSVCKSNTTIIRSLLRRGDCLSFTTECWCNKPGTDWKNSLTVSRKTIWTRWWIYPTWKAVSVGVPVKDNDYRHCICVTKCKYTIKPKLLWWHICIKKNIPQYLSLT